MNFWIVLGKNKLHVFEGKGNYERVYINGKESFDYDITKAEIDVKRLMEILADEYSMDSVDQISFMVLMNPKEGINDIFKRVLGKHMVGRFNIDTIIAKIIKSLSNNKKLMIDQYGINFDDFNYKMDGSKVVVDEFSLLSYTIDDNLFIDCIRTA